MRCRKYRARTLTVLNTITALAYVFQFISSFESTPQIR